MSKQFHVMRKDGSELSACGNLGTAMDRMGAGMVMFLGSGEEALKIAAALNKANIDRKRTSGMQPGTLLHIGMEGGTNGNN